jgi:cell division protein DivIC
MKLFAHIPTWLKNKYLVAIVAFGILMLFFDKNDVFLQLQRANRAKELEKTEAHQNILIMETQQELGFLKNSVQTIEKYAREKYMMKKDNEDLFIVNTVQERK